MNAKRSTPVSKGGSRGPPSASKFRSPSNLNSSVLGRGSASKSTSKRENCRSRTYLDLTNANATLGACPNVKPDLKSPITPLVDYYEFECDLEYCDYLQVLMKKQILGNIMIEKHTQDISDQLVIQKDNLHQSKMMLRKNKKELEEMDQLYEVNDLLSALEKTLDKYSSLTENNDLKNTLEQLLNLFESACNKVSVKNVEVIKDEMTFEKLKVLFEKNVAVFERMEAVFDDREKVHDIANLVKMYKEKVRHVAQQQKSTTNAQNDEMYKLFKAISDHYAEKEKY